MGPLISHGGRDSVPRIGLIGGVLMKLWNTARVAAVLATAIFTGTALAATPQVMVNGEWRPAYREGEVIVKYKDGAIRSMRDQAELYSRLDVQHVDRFSGHFKSFEHLAFNTSQRTVEEVVAELQRDPSVEYAQPNFMIYAYSPPSAQNKVQAEPCLIPGVPFPPGCEGGGGGEQPAPPPGGDQPQPGTPCLIPGIPFPPGCDDSGGPGNPPGQPGQPGNPGNNPAIQPPPAEVNPPVADPDLSRAWGIAKTSADKAWAINKGSKDVIVAVIDTGVDYNHPDLAFNMWRNPKAARALATGVNASGDDVTGDVVGYDFVNNDNLPFDDNQHGTHCAGSVGAVGGNGVGVAGMAQRVSIMAVKFLSGEGSGDTAGAIKSIDYAVSRGAKILSNSWGGKGDDGSNNALKDAIARSEAAGVLFVAAAGNDGTDNDRDPVFPASFNLPNMVTVAATTEQDGMAFFSNRGARTVHVGAPGNNVYSTVPGGKYARLSGTSMACPHVAGAAAVIWSQFPNADFKEVKRRLMDGGDTISALNGRTVSGKRINLQKSLQPNL
jgi:subtilisin family serine protease